MDKGIGNSLDEQGVPATTIWPCWMDVKGVCWKLFSQLFHDDTLLPETAPEMTRTPLDELIFQICLLYEQWRDEHHATTATTWNDNKRPFPP
jgi:hypothetical protein